MPAIAKTIRSGDQCARTGRWRVDEPVAFLVPGQEGARLSAEFVNECLRLLGQQGFREVVTGALSAGEQAGFLAAGFEVRERLDLLVLSLGTTLGPLPPGRRLYRVGPRRRAGVLAVDRSAFPPFWRLDRASLHEALRATPLRHFRVVLDDRRKVVGYAICGVAGSRGFVQRLAVTPSARRGGLGTRLLLDGLGWMRSAGARQVVVNTQEGNSAALALYKSVGFRQEADGLCVLSAAVKPTAARPSNGAR